MKPFLYISAILLLANPSQAWLRRPIPDLELAQRAELIVVAHIRAESIVYVPHQVADGEGMNWEHHATLVITEVVKGTYTQKELPIIIHYGLDPMVEIGRDVHMFSDKNIKKYITPATPVALYDHPGEMSGEYVDDICKDQIWFLQQKDPDYFTGGDSIHGDTVGAPGIWDPEDVQPPYLKPFFAALLTGHPEEKIKEFTGGESPLAIRSRNYLEDLKIKEILKEPDAAKRADLLLPYFLFTDERRKGPTQSEAAFQLWKSCGEAGAARLVPVFRDPVYSAMQFDIMGVWSSAQYREAIPILIDLLKSENKFWADMTPEERDAWIHPTPYHSSTREQGASRRRVEYILMAFKQLADPRTRQLLEESKEFWKKLDPKLSDECDEALLSIQNDEIRKRKGQ